MFLSISGAAVASNLGSATEIITNGILIDIADGVDGFFDEYDDGTIFRGWVDRQQERGWLCADLLALPLLEPGTARAERGTARGVGNEVAKEAKKQEKLAGEQARQARKRVRSKADALPSEVEKAAQDARDALR